MSEKPRKTEVDYVLSQNQKFDVASALGSDLEQATLDTKKLLCDGTFLKGHTVTNRDILKSTLREQLIEVQRAVFQMASLADIDPEQLAHNVLEGKS